MIKLIAPGITILFFIVGLTSFTRAETPNKNYQAALINERGEEDIKEVDEQKEKPKMKANVVLKSGKQFTLSGISTDSASLTCYKIKFEITGPKSTIPISSMKRFKFISEKEKGDEKTIIYKAVIILTNLTVAEYSFEKQRGFSGESDIGEYHVRWEDVKSIDFYDHPTLSKEETAFGVLLYSIIWSILGGIFGCIIGILCQLSVKVPLKLFGSICGFFFTLGGIWIGFAIGGVEGAEEGNTFGFGIALVVIILVCFSLAPSKR